MIALTALVLAAIALKPQEAPQDRSQDAGWHNRQSLALAERTGKDGWQTLEGGVRFRRVKGDGTGAHPTPTDMVKIHYAGSLTDGTEFDSSFGRGEPATFPLDQLIPAWQIAVPKMGVGDTAEIAVPAELGYGPYGKGPIPGGATLLFKIELLGIEGR